MKKLVLLMAAVALVLTGCNLPVKVSVSVFASPTPTITSTPTPTPTVTPSPTPSPTPTPPPAVQVKQAEEAMFLGDYELARREFQSAYASAAEPALRAAAALGIGRALYHQGNYPAAIEALQAMLAAFPEDEQAPTALFYLGKSYDAQEGYADAAQTYARLAERGPAAVLDVIHELRGDALLAAGDFNGAVEAFNAAIAAAPEWKSTVWTEMKLAGAYASLNDYTNAIKTYLAVYDKSDNEYVRAQANLLMGQIYLSIGQAEQANARFLDSVLNYPRAYDSYTGLVHLVNSGVPVDELARGIVDYYAGQYGLAVEAFRRYIDRSDQVDGKVYYFLALARLAMNEPGNAIANLDYLIETFPGDRYWASAFEEKAYIQWSYLDDFEAAASTLLQFVELAPESSEAPAFLFDAARIQERAGLLLAAAENWERLLNTYPAYENSHRGLFLAGISYYRAGDYAKALLVFQRNLVLATTPDEEAAAYLWIGKSQQALGNAEEMRAAWQQAAQRDPTGYYSERANELLAGQDPFTTTRPVDLGYDLNQERPEAEAWLRATFSLPSELDLSGLGDLAAHPRIQRGQALWRFGLWTEARNEFEEARKAVLNNPADTYRLMNYLYDLGLFRSALLASRHILDLAGLDDVGTLKAPAYFNHIRFGVYYKDLVLAAAQNEKLHPLLLLSVIRQESLFEGFATSSAGARGLMQIMPATGEEIAANMNWPEGYTTNDLYRPAISIPMGARYLARQRDYFNGSLFAALAAYNGGPGNTIAWNQMANGDPDLLMEVIRADETRKYIRQIYEFFNLYRLLYERGL